MLKDRFDLIQFDVGGGQKELEINIHETLNFSSFYGIGSIVPLEGQCGMSIQSTTNLNNSISMEGSSIITNEFESNLVKTLYVEMCESLPNENTTKVCKEVNHTALFENNLDSQVGLNKNVPMVGLSEVFNENQVILSRDYINVGFIPTYIDSSYIIGNYEDITIELEGLEIPPGSRVFIDTENCEVLMDNKDIMYSHEGGWVYLDNSVINIEISYTGGNNCIDSNLMYRELFV